MADEHDHPGVIHDQKYCAICKTEVSINDTKFSTTLCCGLLHHTKCAYPYHWDANKKCKICFKTALDISSSKGIELVREWIKKNKSWARVNLGCLHSLTRSNPNLEESGHIAVQLFEQAFKQGNMLGGWNLAELYQYGFGDDVPQSYSLANKYYQILAEKGHATAQCCFANNLFDGFGSVVNKMKAYHLYIQSSEGGNRMAMYNLANMIWRGDEEVEQSNPKAIELYKKSAALGSNDAIKKLVSIDCDKQYAEWGIFRNFDPGAEHVLQGILSEHAPGTKGYADKLFFWVEKEKPWAYFYVAELLFEGWWKVSKNAPISYSKANLFYEKALSQKYYLAAIALGFAHWFGHGVEQNYSKAAEYYCIAAEQNENAKAKVLALTNLGTLYSNGHLKVAGKRDLLKAQDYWAAAVKTATAATAAEDDPEKYFYVDGALAGIHGTVHQIENYLSDLQRHILGKTSKQGVMVSCASCSKSHSIRSKDIKKCPCKSVYYCDNANKSLQNKCQRAHWPTHKTDHRRIVREKKEEMEEQKKKKLQQQEKAEPNMCAMCDTAVSTKYMEGYTYMLCCGEIVHNACWGKRKADKTLSNTQKNQCALCNEKADKFTSKQIIKAHEKWVKQDHYWACDMLADLYVQGRDGVKKDRTKALYYWEVGAKLGSFAAQYNLGVSYQNGKGVNIDHAKAKEYYEMAALQGDAESQFCLGACYIAQRGIKREQMAWIFKRNLTMEEITANKNGVMEMFVGFIIDKGMKWFAKAAEQGHKNAIKALELHVKNKENKSGHRFKKKSTKQKKKNKKNKRR